MSETRRAAIVTGAAGGIGRVFVRNLLAAGIDVAATDRDEGPLAALVAVARDGGNAAELMTFRCDLEADGATEAIASVIGRLPSSPFSLSITSNSGPTFLITATF
jgi:NAD(P)-dependent dehydrogenase (short-subunit alcohol dehydrogenase family)